MKSSIAVLTTVAVLLTGLAAGTPAAAAGETTHGATEQRAAAELASETVTGRIVAPDGRPIPGLRIEVSLYGNRSNAVTEVDGTFAVPRSTSGSYELYIIYARGLTPAGYPVNTAFTPTVKAEDFGDLVLTAVPAFNGLRFDGASGRTLAPGATVQVERPDGSDRRQALVQPDGSFNVGALEAGEWKVEAWGELSDGARFWRRGHVTIDDPTELNLTATDDDVYEEAPAPEPEPVDPAEPEPEPVEPVEPMVPIEPDPVPGPVDPAPTDPEPTYPVDPAEPDPGEPTEPEVPRLADFTDNPVGSLFYDSVRWMQEAGITTGYTDGTYQKGRSISRGESVTFIHRYLKPTSAAEGSFEDAPAGHSFAVPIAWAASEGVATGYTDGTFKPGRQVTRGEFASFLYRAADADPAGAHDFPDVAAGNAHQGAIAWAAENGMVTGYADGTFRPGKSITRGEVAAVMSRYAG